MLRVLADDSLGTLALENNGKFYIRARICTPYLQEFRNLVSGAEYSAMMNEGSIPITLLKAMIIQHTPQGYFLSTQTKGDRKSAITLLGKVDNATGAFVA